MWGGGEKKSFVKKRMQTFSSNTEETEQVRQLQDIVSSGQR